MSPVPSPSWGRYGGLESSETKSCGNWVTIGRGLHMGGPLKRLQGIKQTNIIRSSKISPHFDKDMLITLMQGSM